MEKEYSLRSFCCQQGTEKLLAEWDTEKNAPLTPDDIHKGSHKKVWWCCDAGHSWQAEVRVRTSGARCPYCAGRILWTGSNDLAAVDPALAAQWDPEKNGSLTPEHVLPGSGRYAWWRCEKGHSWRASIRSRSRGNGCPAGGHAGRDGSGHHVPGVGGGMGHGTQREADAGSGGGLQQSEGLVALCPGP